MMIRRRCPLAVCLALVLISVGPLSGWSLAAPFRASGWSAEFAGTQQVLKLLRPVNVHRAEARAKQGVVDIWDVKNQLDAQNPLLRPDVTGLRRSGKTGRQPAGSKATAGSLRSPYKY